MLFVTWLWKENFSRLSIECVHLFCLPMWYLPDPMHGKMKDECAEAWRLGEQEGERTGTLPSWTSLPLNQLAFSCCIDGCYIKFLHSQHHYFETAEGLLLTCTIAQLSPKIWAFLTSMLLDVVRSFEVNLSKFPHKPANLPWNGNRRVF